MVRVLVLTLLPFRPHGVGVEASPHQADPPCLVWSTALWLGLEDLHRRGGKCVGEVAVFHWWVGFDWLIFFYKNVTFHAPSHSTLFCTAPLF
ncbi:hypothetical protein HanRHA438_Chr11g0503751 [Helianthus annuus]|nr:hypothetical protein HanRHA438_Chr11g0503751 [Helianthus annuus]